MDIGPQNPKVRLDYWDVMISLARNDISGRFSSGIIGTACFTGAIVPAAAGRLPITATISARNAGCSVPATTEEQGGVFPLVWQSEQFHHITSTNGLAPGWRATIAAGGGVSPDR